MWDNVNVIFEVIIRQSIWLMMPARRTQEILMLRRELQVLKRSSKRPKLTSCAQFLTRQSIAFSWSTNLEVIVSRPNYQSPQQPEVCIFYEERIY
jgi:hypothetical protein